MKNVRQALTLALALLLLGAACAFAKQGGKKPPLSEADLLKMVKTDLEDEVIVTVIKQRGISFQADGPALQRLKAGGASEAVLAALRPSDAKAKPAADEAKPAAGDDRPLATARTDDGLTAEILEVRPTRNETLLIRWRYRNSTKAPVQLIAPTPRFASFDSPPNTAAKFYKSVYYTWGKFETAAAYNEYILVEGDEKVYKPVAKDLGKNAVVVRPDQEFELWAQFSLPKKGERTISLHLLGAPLIKNLPIQPAEK